MIIDFHYGGKSRIAAISGDFIDISAKSLLQGRSLAFQRSSTMGFEVKPL